MAALTCQTPSAEGVVVHIGAEGTRHVTGIQRCKSVGSCPVCSPTIRSTRAADIEAAVEAWHALGGDVWFLTLTVPHGPDDWLGDTLTRIQTMWRQMTQGTGWRNLRRDGGVQGMVRAWEITWTETGGWHPHIHVLIFANSRRLEPLRVIEQWRSRWDHNGFGDRWVPHVSADIRKVSRRSGGIAAYLGKVNMEWGAGLELARADAKVGRGLNAAQLLELAATGEVEWVERWRDWERCTKGMRWIEWGRGLRDRAAGWQLQALAQGVELEGVPLLIPEKTDEEAASAEDADDVVASWHVPAEVWSAARARGQLGDLLEALVRDEGERWGCWRITPWVPPDWRPPGLEQVEGTSVMA